MTGPLDGAPNAPDASHPLCRFVLHSCCSGWLCPDWWVSPWNPKRCRPLDNHGPYFGYGCCIPRCRGHIVRGVGWHTNSCLLHLFTVPARARRFASSVVTSRGYKTGGRSCAQPTSSCMIFHPLLSSFPTAEKKKRWRNRSRNRRELLSLQGVAPPSLLSHGGVGLVHIRGDAIAPTKPLESGVVVAELTTCHMPEDPASPVLMGGYVVAYAMFYEWGFCVPSH
jgi:hypothetical protein